MGKTDERKSGGRVGEMKGLGNIRNTGGTAREDIFENFGNFTEEFRRWKWRGEMGVTIVVWYG